MACQRACEAWHKTLSGYGRHDRQHCGDEVRAPWGYGALLGGWPRRGTPQRCIAGDREAVGFPELEVPVHAPSLRAVWGSRRYWRHVMLGMTPVISSSESCHVTPGKHCLLQHSRVSPVSPAWHDPEA